MAFGARERQDCKRSDDENACNSELLLANAQVDHVVCHMAGCVGLSHFPRYVMLCNG